MVTYINRRRRIVLFMLFSLNFLFSQKIEKIKNLDTLYVFFEGKKNNYKQVSGIKMHAFNFMNNSNNYNPLWFYDYSFNRNLTIKKNKKFLKNNKDKIITYEFLKNYEYREVMSFFEKKTIFLIDKKDFCLFKIKLKKVRVSVIEPLSIE